MLLDNRASALLRLEAFRMHEFATGDNPEDQQVAGQKWKGAPAIRLAHQLNERCIDLFCELAIESAPENPWSAVVSNRDLWCRLDAVSRKRLAAFPFVIVDVRFKDDVWWQAMIEHEPAAVGSSAAPGSTPWTRYEWLALEALLCAWQIAREASGVAQLIFAMQPSVAARVAALTMQQVRAIAVAGTQALRIRWDDDPKFWRELLLALRDEDASALATLRREAKLLFGGELLNVSGT